MYPESEKAVIFHKYDVPPNKALTIIKLKPHLNLKEKLLTVQRFLGHRPRV